MISTNIMVIVLILIVFILLLDRAGSILKKASPSTIKYIDYGSFGTAVVAGIIIYMGKGNAYVSYLFYLSLIIYFIALRHSVYQADQSKD